MELNVISFWEVIPAIQGYIVNGHMPIVENSS